jgi:polyhydroxyalkanoate synthesis regulator phasin
MPVSKTAGYSQARPVMTATDPSKVVSKTAGYSQAQPAIVSSQPVSGTAGGAGSAGGTGGGGSAGGGYSAAAQSEAERNAMLKSMEDFLRNSSDAQYKQQEAGFAKTRDEQVSGIQRAFDEAVKTGQLSIEEANLAFDGAVKQLDANLYRDSQLTNISSFDRGIQNSQQMIALQQGDVARKNTQQTEFSTERTRRVNALTDRIASITKQKDLDVNQARTDYNYNITGARASADQSLNEGLFQLKQSEYSNMQAMAQALASRSFNGGGGGGGKTQNTPSYDLGDTSSMAKNFNEFVASKQTTSYDDYVKRMQVLTSPKKTSVMDNRGSVFGSIPSLANNPTLTAYEKMKIMGG